MPYKCYVFTPGMEPRPGALLRYGPPDQTMLSIYLPNGNWYRLENSPERCEIVGSLPGITIVKRDSDPNHECSIADWRNGKRFHGFLWHGDLFDIDFLAESREEWDTLSRADQIDVIAKVGPPGYIAWPIREVDR